MELEIFQFVSLILLILITGVLWGTWFSLSRSIENFSGEEFIHIGKTTIANLAPPMRIIMHYQLDEQMNVRFEKFFAEDKRPSPDEIAKVIADIIQNPDSEFRIAVGQNPNTLLTST